MDIFAEKNQILRLADQRAYIAVAADFPLS